MIPHDRDELDVFAGEYVLGTLDAIAAVEAEQAMATNEALRAAIDRWQSRLHPLTALADAGEPDPATWSIIQARIAAGTTRATRAGPWYSVALWRGIAAAALVLAAGLALYTALAPTVPSPNYIALLHAPHETSADWVAIVDKDGLSLQSIQERKVAAGRSYELWAIAPGTTKPEALGMIAPDGTLKLRTLPAAVAEGTTLAVSIEPLGGSPNGRPTGPVVFTGSVTRVL
jgi:anti-sigma-K factor RskA